MTNRLQVCVFAQDGDVVVQSSPHGTKLTVRNPEREEIAAVLLTAIQAQMLGDVLNNVSYEDD